MALLPHGVQTYSRRKWRPWGIWINILYVYIHLMAQSTHAPRTEFSRPGANPTLETIEYIRTALREADGPLSRNQLLAILSRWEHSTTRQSLNAAIAFLGADGSVAEGSKGLIWVPSASTQLTEIIHKGQRL
jgi:hypothetical protein